MIAATRNICLVHAEALHSTKDRNFKQAEASQEIQQAQSFLWQPAVFCLPVQPFMVWKQKQFYWLVTHTLVFANLQKLGTIVQSGSLLEPGYGTAAAKSTILELDSKLS